MLLLSLRLLSIVLIIFEIISIFKYTFKKENRDLLSILFVTYVTWILAYIYFNISMPYSCTIHARYIITAILIVIIYIGILYNNAKNNFLKICIFVTSWLFEILSIMYIFFSIINEYL